MPRGAARRAAVCKRPVAVLLTGLLPPPENHGSQSAGNKLFSAECVTQIPFRTKKDTMNFQTLMMTVSVAVVLVMSAADAPASERPNILFIAIDDMNDWTGFLGGHPQAKTPNMDALAQRSISFTNAHCVAPACSPCRNALLFGVEPFHSGLYPFYDADRIPASVRKRYLSLPQFFKENGYGTFGAGKIHHGSKASPQEWDSYHVHKGPPLKYNAAAGYQQGDSKKGSHRS